MSRDKLTYVILAYEDKEEYSVYPVIDEMAVRAEIEKKRAAGRKISFSFYKKTRRAVDEIARVKYPNYGVTGIRGR